MQRRCRGDTSPQEVQRRFCAGEKQLCWNGNRLIDSQKHRLAWVGKDLRDDIVSTPNKKEMGIRNSFLTASPIQHAMLCSGGSPLGSLPVVA